MSLGYILKRVQSDAGFTVDINTEQRDLLIDIINEAAREVYNEKDLPVVLKEVYVKATNNKIITLPPFVGEVRGVRSKRWNNRWTLSDMRPRYSQVDWTQKESHVRIIGETALANELLSSSPLTFEIPAGSQSLIYTTIGETNESNRAIDNISGNIPVATGLLNYTDITSIKKNIITPFNVTIKDGDGNELALIYADQFESRYLLADVSCYPNIVDCDDGTFVMEVLYKPRLNKLKYDEDEFPLRDYDDIIVLRTKQLLAEGEEGKEQRALLMYQKSQQKLNNQINDKTGTIQKKLAVARNPLLGLRRKFFRCY